MKMLSKAERNKLPSGVFADPDRQLFPIRNQSDATETATLLSKVSAPFVKPIKDRLASIASEKGWKLPASFSESSEDDSDEVVADSVLFEIGDDSYEEGDFVIYPQRKLFPAGWYQSHNYGMTPEELAVAAYAATEVPLDIDHRDSIIKDEYIGRAKNFTAAWEGEDWVKRGDIAIHKLLNPLLKDETKMSTTWNRETKELTKVALLLNPRIPDAELKPVARAFTEFAKKHETPSGKAAIQDLHDTAVRKGAVCDAKNAELASKDESKAIQAVHDQMVAAGAKCESEKNRLSWSYYTDDSGPAGEEEASVNKATTGAGETPSPAAATADMTQTPSPEIVAMQKQIAEMTRKARKKDAEIAFSELRREGRITPGLQGHFESLYEQLLADDEANSVSVKFGAKDDEAASRADLLKALFKGVVPHRHSEEMMKVKIGEAEGDAKVLYEETEESDTRKRISARAQKYANNGKAASNGKAATK